MPTELAPGVHRLATDYPHVCGLPLWLHVIDAGDELVLLDAGIASTPEAATGPELKKLGHDLADLTLVVNSHAHPDHMGGNAILKDRSGARLAAPAAEAGWLEDNETLVSELWGSDPAAMDLDERERAELFEMLGDRVRIDLLLRDGDLLPSGDRRMRVITTSGHSPGHIAVLDERSRTLFSFDDVQGRGQRYLDGNVWLAPLYTDVERYVGGLQRLLELDFDALVPSHGDVLTADQGRQKVEQSLEWVHDVHEFTTASLRRKGSLTVRELAGSIGTELGDFGGICLQTVRMARAHLELLGRRGGAEPRWHHPG
ncbi:glyoxylase-like metal-dependent hydrolase (beta-lactamase superfamily II) [Kribbella orskensis]|uniref:Glyoxylase-like metal-dependent hydrolase (Beta-lactamase superfamily II) n=1 Tax=Kribbella orskensis TaxID=2512216 RepID=A0ABY2BI38_9ACTN|nr:MULTISPECIES: MBL fold metallo-hydrolase [Kribbella]TCN38283.1 glyoxylase-like metal-dependent hydrolase (beta-lactamase superfamily II) [Kribbella sp. VKM Ac-2500]TCO20187.1 glyoxylase-like metal-dependent hydrolase (beta-lactamase superfamily II) [Kribbella orskensis]